LSEFTPAAVIILAAGAGTRMKSATPKVLHRVAGRTLLQHAVDAAVALASPRVVAVVRHEREAVVAHLAQIAPHVLVADQDAVPGTGRAVWCGLSALDAITVAAAVATRGAGSPAALEHQVEGAVVVTSGDVPLVDGTLLAALVAAHAAQGNAVTILSAEVAAPSGYGRIVRDSQGLVTAIVEERDATPAQRAITEINAGIYVFDAGVLRDALGVIGTNNSQAEMYLTDVVAVARARSLTVGAMIAPDASAVAGVNDRVDLAEAAALMNRRIVEQWMRDGVTIIDPATTWIDADVRLGADVTVLPGTQLLGETSVGANSTVGPDTTLLNVRVGADASVVRTHGSDSVIGDDATVGPFSYLRPGTVLGEDGKIGAFVETKNATIGKHSKVPHLSYVGDATIGEYTNIGAATIFVNYDGVTKHRTTVGDHVKVGSDNTLIAPLEIGDGAYTGAGSIIRHNIPPGALGINSSPQQTIEGWVERRRPGTSSAAAAQRAAKLQGNTGALSSEADGARTEPRSTTEGDA